MAVPLEKSHSAARMLSTHSGFSLISDEKLLDLYATMLKCRALDERVKKIRGRDGANGARVPGDASLAAIAAVAIDLLPADTLAPAPGGLLPSFVKGIPVAAILGCASGLNGAKRPSFASLNVVSPGFRSGVQLDRALRAAALSRKKRNRKIAVVFCGDSTGARNELQGALTLASEKKLPVVFVSHLDGMGLLRSNCGVPGVAVDADDAVAIYRVVTEAITHARRGSGPTLIECRPLPMAARKRGKQRDRNHSIRNMEAYLALKGITARRFKAEIGGAFQRELDEAMRILFG